MNEKDRELMERYIYEVIRRVPSAHKEDIRMELQELIEDMYEAESSNMESVLSKLGDPAEFAKKYRDDRSYVISPEYYDNYVWVLKIVLICIAASSILSFIVSTIIDGFAEADLIGPLIYGFGMVTLVFAILERLKVKVDIREKKVWSVNNLNDDINLNKKAWAPNQMRPVPNKKSLISRTETIAGLVFIMIFGAMMIFAPQLFGAYVFDDGKLVRTISIFNLEQWPTIIPVLSLIFFASFIDEIIKLVAGCYCKMVMIGNIVTCALQLVLSVIVFKVLPIWSPTFVDEVVAEFGKEITSKGDILFYWETGLLSNIVLAIICVATAIEIGTTIYKTMRYGVEPIS